MNSDDLEAVLTRLQELYVVTNALLANAKTAPDHICRWASRELEATCEILQRLRPPTIKLGRPNASNPTVKPIFNATVYGFDHQSALATATNKVEVSSLAWAWVKPTTGDDRAARLYILGPDGWKYGGKSELKPA